MDDRTLMLGLMALLLFAAVALLGVLGYLLRPKKKAPVSPPAPAPSRPAKIIGRTRLTKKERTERNLATLEVAARWAKTLYGPKGRPAPGSYAALFRAKGEKHLPAITLQVKRWLGEG